MLPPDMRRARPGEDAPVERIAPQLVTTTSSDSTRGADISPEAARRIQLSRRKGWRKPEGAVVVARPTRWGNPFPVAEHGRAEAVRLYEEHLLASPELLAAARAGLAGRDLACWCPPGEPCHADVLLRIVSEDAAR